MPDVLLLYHFTRPIVVSESNVPTLEYEIFNYVRQYLLEADLIDICVIGSKTRQRYPQFCKSDRANVFIGLITTAAPSLFEEYILNSDVLNDYILENFSRESIYFIKFWNDSGNLYFVVRLIKMSSKPIGKI